jgi:hypothetical protein
MTYMYDPRLPIANNRRHAPRLRLNTRMNEYIADDGYPAVALNVSETGLSIRKPTKTRAPKSGLVALELELPGTNEVIWASAQTRFDATGAEFQFSGLLFFSMARKHQRLLRDYVRERQARLQRLLSPRTVFHSRFGALVS